MISKKYRGYRKIFAITISIIAISVIVAIIYIRNRDHSLDESLIERRRKVHVSTLPEVLPGDSSVISSRYVYESTEREFSKNQETISVEELFSSDLKNKVSKIELTLEADVSKWLQSMSIVADENFTNCLTMASAYSGYEAFEQFKQSFAESGLQLKDYYRHISGSEQEIYHILLNDASRKAERSFNILKERANIITDGRFSSEQINEWKQKFFLPINLIGNILVDSLVVKDVMQTLGRIDYHLLQDSIQTEQTLFNIDKFVTQNWASLRENDKTNILSPSQLEINTATFDNNRLFAILSGTLLSIDYYCFVSSKNTLAFNHIINYAEQKGIIPDSIKIGLSFEYETIGDSKFYSVYFYNKKTFFKDISTLKLKAIAPPSFSSGSKYVSFVLDFGKNSKKYIERLTKSFQGKHLAICLDNKIVVVNKIVPISDSKILINIAATSTRNLVSSLCLFLAAEYGELPMAIRINKLTID
jgi:hypothetical protein